MTLYQLEQEALLLPAALRARLAERLVESLTSARLDVGTAGVGCGGGAATGRGSIGVWWLQDGEEVLAAGSKSGIGVIAWRAA